jgi:hypothetical protein
VILLQDDHGLVEIGSNIFLQRGELVLQSHLWGDKGDRQTDRERVREREREREDQLRRERRLTFVP